MEIKFFGKDSCLSIPICNEDWVIANINMTNIRDYISDFRFYVWLSSLGYLPLSLLTCTWKNSDSGLLRKIF